MPKYLQINVATTLLIIYIPIIMIPKRSKYHRSKWISREIQKENSAALQTIPSRMGGATKDPSPLLSGGLYCRMPLGGRKWVAYKRDARGKFKPEIRKQKGHNMRAKNNLFDSDRARV